MCTNVQWGMSGRGYFCVFFYAELVSAFGANGGYFCPHFVAEGEARIGFRM